MKKKIVIFVIVFLSCGMFWTSSSSAFLPFLSSQETPSNQDPESEKQVSSYNEQAVELFEQGQFEEAQELWEKALEILEHPVEYVQQGQAPDDGLDFIDEELILLEGEGHPDRSEVNKLYDTAVTLFKKEKYVASKKMFERIESVIPDHKAARNYLTILEHKIRQAQQNLSGKSFEKNAVARREERAEWERILEESRMELEKKLGEQADPLYQEAISYYKSRDFKLARDYFTEVNGILTGYKDTDKYLSRISKDIRGEEERLVEEKRKREILARKKEKEEWRRILQESEQELQKKLIQQVDPVYQEAVHYYKKRDFELAKNRFEEAQLIVPNYKSTRHYLDRIDRDLQENVRLRQEQRARELEQKKREEELARKREEKRFEELQMTKEQARLDRFKTEVASRRKEREEWLRALEESETERQRKLEEQAQFIYQEAIKYYKKREFEQAKEDFLEVQKIVPGYKSTGKYLSRIDKDIEKEQKQRHEDQEMAFRRRMREKKMLEQQKWEENEKLRAAEDQDRLREFKEKTLARKKQREEWERVIEENEHERQRKLGEEAEFIYQEALRAYSATRWEEARADFTEVARILPGYKLTEKYLSGLDDDIQKEEQERRRTIQETLKERNQKEVLARKQEEKHQQDLRKIIDKKDFQRKEVQAEAVYQFAVSLYKREKYEQAKDKFLEADQILSGYRATEKYLKNIDRDIKKAERSREKEQQIVFEQQLREQRLAQKREESRLEQMRTSEEDRRLLKLREEASLRERERKQWEDTIRDIEKEHLKRLSQQTESVYDEALRYYKAGWFEQARETLEEVDAMWPGYKSTEKYFARIDSEIRKNRRLRRESEEDIVERQKWQEELAQQKKDDRQWHVRKAEDQERLEELKKETLARRREKEKLKESMEDVEREHQRRLKKKAKTIYLKAVKHYKAREFEKAKTAFIEVERTLPDYKSTEKYLARLDKDIMDEKIDMEKRVVKSLEGYAEEPDPYALEKNGHKFVKKVSQEREKEFSREAETKYREALAFYKAREFIRAKLKFIDVESLSPGYKATLDYLGRIDKDIGEKQRLWMEQQTGRAEKEEPLFEDQEAPVLGQKREVVEQALLDVERYFQEAVPQETVRSLLKERVKQKEQPVDWEQRIQERRNELRNQRRQVQREYEKQFKQLYTRAVGLYRSGSYEEAKALFLQIEQMKPGYKKASSYLKKSEAKIRKGLQRKSQHSVVLQPKEIKARNGVVEEALDDLEQKL